MNFSLVLLALVGLVAAAPAPQWGATTTAAAASSTGPDGQYFGRPGGESTVKALFMINADNTGKPW